MTLEKALDDIRSIAERYGLKPQPGSDGVIIRHYEAPLEVVVRVSGGEAVVELRAASGLGEFIDGLLGENEDPRDTLEKALEEMLRIVDVAVDRLAREGVAVKRQTREAVLDVYDALEERLEEG